MRITLAADHAGVALKTRIRDALGERNVAVHDCGPSTDDAVDYPDYAALAARRVAVGEADLGILVCGSGIGMAIAANKVPGIRAARATDANEARLARAHNDANVLTLGARSLSVELALATVDAFLNTPFSGGRHQGRVAKIMALETESDATATVTLPQ